MIFVSGAGCFRIAAKCHASRVSMTLVLVKNHITFQQRRIFCLSLTSIMGNVALWAHVSRQESAQDKC